ncbi:Uncharacterized protein FKW44_025295, partial [Caligus rogercresseyi]
EKKQEKKLPSSEEVSRPKAANKHLRETIKSGSRRNSRKSKRPAPREEEEDIDEIIRSITSMDKSSTSKRASKKNKRRVGGMEKVSSEDEKLLLNDGSSSHRSLDSTTSGMVDEMNGSRSIGAKTAVSDLILNKDAVLDSRKSSSKSVSPEKLAKQKQSSKDAISRLDSDLRSGSKEGSPQQSEALQFDKSSTSSNGLTSSEHSIAKKHMSNISTSSTNTKESKVTSVKNIQSPQIINLGALNVNKDSMPQTSHESFKVQSEPSKDYASKVSTNITSSKTTEVKVTSVKDVPSSETKSRDVNKDSRQQRNESFKATSELSKSKDSVSNEKPITAPKTSKVKVTSEKDVPSLDSKSRDINIDKDSAQQRNESFKTASTASKSKDSVSNEKTTKAPKTSKVKVTSEKDVPSLDSKSRDINIDKDSAQQRNESFKTASTTSKSKDSVSNKKTTTAPKTSKAKVTSEKDVPSLDSKSRDINIDKGSAQQRNESFKTASTASKSKDSVSNEKTITAPKTSKVKVTSEKDVQPPVTKSRDVNVDKDNTEQINESIKTTSKSKEFSSVISSTTTKIKSLDKVLVSSATTQLQMPSSKDVHSPSLANSDALKVDKSQGNTDASKSVDVTKPDDISLTPEVKSSTISESNVTSSCTKKSYDFIDDSCDDWMNAGIGDLSDSEESDKSAKQSVDKKIESGSVVSSKSTIYNEGKAQTIKDSSKPVELTKPKDQSSTPEVKSSTISESNVTSSSTKKSYDFIDDSCDDWMNAGIGDLSDSEESDKSAKHSVDKNIESGSVVSSKLTIHNDSKTQTIKDSSKPVELTKLKDQSSTPEHKEVIRFIDDSCDDWMNAGIGDLSDSEESDKSAKHSVDKNIESGSDSSKPVELTKLKDQSSTPEVKSSTISESNVTSSSTKKSYDFIDDSCDDWMNAGIGNLSDSEESDKSAKQSVVKEVKSSVTKSHTSEVTLDTNNKTQYIIDSTKSLSKPKSSVKDIKSIASPDSNGIIHNDMQEIKDPLKAVEPVVKDIKLLSTDSTVRVQKDGNTQNMIDSSTSVEHSKPQPIIEDIKSSSLPSTVLKEVIIKDSQDINDSSQTVDHSKPAAIVKDIKSSVVSSTSVEHMKSVTSSSFVSSADSNVMVQKDSNAQVDPSKSVELSNPKYFVQDIKSSFLSSTDTKDTSRKDTQDSSYSSKSVDLSKPESVTKDMKSLNTESSIHKGDSSNAQGVKPIVVDSSTDSSATVHKDSTHSSKSFEHSNSQNFTFSSSTTRREVKTSINMSSSFITSTPVKSSVKSEEFQSSSSSSNEKAPSVKPSNAPKIVNPDKSSEETLPIVSLDSHTSQDRTYSSIASSSLPRKKTLHTSSQPSYPALIVTLQEDPKLVPEKDADGFETVLNRTQRRQKLNSLRLSSTECEDTIREIQEILDADIERQVTEIPMPDHDTPLEKSSQIPLLSSSSSTNTTSVRRTETTTIQLSESALTQAPWSNRRTKISPEKPPIYPTNASSANESHNKTKEPSSLNEDSQISNNSLLSDSSLQTEVSINISSRDSTNNLRGSRTNLDVYDDDRPLSVSSSRSGYIPISARNSSRLSPARQTEKLELDRDSSDVIRNMVSMASSLTRPSSRSSFSESRFEAERLHYKKRDSMDSGASSSLLSPGAALTESMSESGTLLLIAIKILAMEALQIYEACQIERKASAPDTLRAPSSANIPSIPSSPARPSTPKQYRRISDNRYRSLGSLSETGEPRTMTKLTKLDFSSISSSQQQQITQQVSQSELQSRITSNKDSSTEMDLENESSLATAKKKRSKKKKSHEEDLQTATTSLDESHGEKEEPDKVKKRRRARNKGSNNEEPEDVPGDSSGPMSSYHEQVDGRPSVALSPSSTSVEDEEFEELKLDSNDEVLHKRIFDKDGYEISISRRTRTNSRNSQTDLEEAVLSAVPLMSKKPTPSEKTAPLADESSSSRLSTNLEKMKKTPKHIQIKDNKSYKREEGGFHR